MLIREALTSIKHGENEFPGVIKDWICSGIEESFIDTGRRNGCEYSLPFAGQLRILGSLRAKLSSTTEKIKLHNYSAPNNLMLAG